MLSGNTGSDCEAVLYTWQHQWKAVRHYFQEVWIKVIEMINFEDCPINDRVYSGAAGRKLGVVYEGQNYILKFPGNLKDKQLKNIKMGYSNAPVSEYIGSHVYELIGMPVHETKLGVYKNRVVVGCKDFLSEGENLIEFEKIKSMIYEIPCISDVRKKFYTSMISMRYEKVLLPTFQELVNMRSR